MAENQASEVGSSAAGEANLAGAFWAAAPAPSEERTARAVAQHALAAIATLASGAKLVSGEHAFLLADLPGHFAKGLDLGYAAPEVARGESFDERALVFTLGVLIFERLTSRHPFGDNQQEQLIRLRKGEMGASVNQLSSIEAGLRAILIRAMGAYPEDRFSGLEQLTRELRRFVEGSAPAAARPAQAPPPPPPSGGAPALQPGPTEQPAAEIIKLRTVDLQPIPSAVTEVSRVSGRQVPPWLRRAAAPAGYIAIGAALASACFLLFGDSEQTRVVQVRDQSAAPARAAAAPAPNSRPAAAATSRAARTRTAAGPTSAPSRPAKRLSPRARRRMLIGVGREVGGELRACVRRRRPLKVGLVVGADGRVERAKLKGAGLTRRGVRCAKKRLLGLQLPLEGTPPRYLEWRLRLLKRRVVASLVRPRR